MDITKYNQCIALSDFVREVERCDFCAIDQEMTGVDVPETPMTQGQPPEEVYRVKKMAVEAYNAFQIGIALFTRVEDDCYEVRPFNFYLLRSSGDVRLNVSAVSFLATHHMSFQTWLSSGIPYRNAEEEETHKNRNKFSFADPQEGEIMTQILDAVQQWFITDDEQFVKEIWCSSDLARRVPSFINHHFNFSVQTTYEGKPYLAERLRFTFKKMSVKDKEAEEKKNRLEADMEYLHYLGFRSFWNALVGSRKPIVGHNFMHDIMFMFHMHERPLPESYTEFKEDIKTHFPTIYDTKTLATELAGENAFAVTNLGYIYQECRRRAALSITEFARQFRLPPGFYSYNDTAIRGQGKAHEAGYDAYMTGIAFHYLRKYQKENLSALKNVISGFASSYYMFLDGKDKVMNPNTFIIESEKPCYQEEIESLFFVTETAVFRTADNKVEVKKLSYRVSGISKTENTHTYTCFCVTLNYETDAPSVYGRLKGAQENTNSGAEVNVSLLPLLKVTQLA